jgi:wyosine [tRNA(Phe)-imidazoG37] synthetase (radical SAM superfamily)
MNGHYRHLFGPVRSRRLGRSLGIDLVPFKVCTFDCPYCQVGATTSKTIERREYVPVADVLAEFDRWLTHGGQADHLTLAGAGEPTLHARFGEVLAELAARTPIRRVLLSNGSLFHLPEVRSAARRADVVKGTLSAWDGASFKGVHHPHAGLDFETFLAGLEAMRAGFRGEFWLEVFLVAGMNDAQNQVQRIAALARGIRPDRIHLNTAVRPPRDTAVQAVTLERLTELARLFDPVAEVALSRGGHARPDTPPGDGAIVEERLLAMVRRHPCTAADLAVALGVDMAAVERAGGRLVETGALRLEQRAGGAFLVATPTSDSDGRSGGR